MEIKIYKMRDSATIPKLANRTDVGLDLYSDLSPSSINRLNEKIGPVDYQESSLFIYPGQTVIIPTGLVLLLPNPIHYKRIAAFILPRSGLSSQGQLIIPNSPGLIDPGYRGELGVIMKNIGETEVEIKHKTRIAQLVFKEVIIPHLVEVEFFDKTDRGDKGFGSSGL